MKGYCVYLRKSRADVEAEARGEGETLSRHSNMLMELAKKQDLNVVKIYKEIVSGDSIAARPQMQSLLADVSECRYAGVLVAEIERLARGDTIDQGIVAQAFRESSTKIVTPAKTYDPDNEFDEEYFEFSLFMSRREYKTIKRRMQGGRLASVKEGNYISSAAPYGYRKVNPEPKVHTLEIVPEEAEMIRLMYSLYLEGHGAKYIANELDRIGISPQKSTSWEPSSIKKILSNPLYCGMLSWKTKSDGDALYKGRHEPIITEEVFLAVQQKKRTDPAAQLRPNDKLMNYYHNILYCQNCGHQMKRRFIAGSGHEHMLCACRECRGKVVSSTVEAVDEAVIAALRYRITGLEKLRYSGADEKRSKPDKKVPLMAELEKAKRQLSKLYDLLEKEIYDTDTFLERSKKVNDKIRSLEAAVRETEIEKKPSQLPPDEAVRRLQNVIDSFSDSAPEEKNRLLHTALRRIYYYKTERASRSNPSSDLLLSAEFL
ncbi:recombinase family protein [Ruminococcus flavefaciens]|uniref:Site-specific DNA recombinase n=1 Tax=Ruminococcus flavefaciens TaxID=1265 RepID=A0A1M7L2C3_RUMFL|nr:recombinase family protein [Ruminococcus flavefaciens]SHM71989.1 Site-specific DNA recombinase [Ruminococcus flavefaciens]